jgi:CheY-like chemotaxis protein
VGIAPEHLEHIFDEFYQIRNPERDRSKGTGLGLAICKRLIDAIGCSLDVDSQLDRGTTFRVRVPAALVSEADGEPRPNSAPAANGDHVLAGLQVLVVEDHETTRLAVTRLLAAHGAIVDPAEDGRAALRHLRHGIHDVLLLDLMLPDMDGREILRELQSGRPERLKCILAVSGDVSEARRRELQSLGASDLIPKPVEMAHLVQRISAAVDSLAETSEPGAE